MPDIAGAMNMEVRLPLTENPGFLTHAFVELEDEGTVAIGVSKGNGYYAFARITPAQFWRMSRALFPEGDPGNADDEVRRGGD